MANIFEETIKKHLEERAASDPLFAANYAKPDKSIAACAIYIIGEAKKSEREGFADEEVYSMAAHYYDEDDIIVGKAVDCRVVVNQTLGAPEKAANATKNEEPLIHFATPCRKQNSIIQPALFDL